MRLGTQPFLWKWVLFAWERKMISISKAEHLPSFWNRGPGELGNGLFNVCFGSGFAFQNNIHTLCDFSAWLKSFSIGSWSVATNTLLALIFFTTFLTFLRISFFGGKHISYVSFLEPSRMHCGEAKNEVCLGSLTCSHALSCERNNFFGENCSMKDCVLR